jgi:hypothetical protein
LEELFSNEEKRPSVNHPCLQKMGAQKAPFLCPQTVPNAIKYMVAKMDKFPREIKKGPRVGNFGGQLCISSKMSLGKAETRSLRLSK